ncbi:hypothetical protein HH310_28880 [Actinoplanes sp. TBRC 11911]|uniref:hypothetical protein n=1 Tax=Actinoplanes sp. TBRC 11911 TaxID=2729386 RepID=UPI00145E2E56|nr:hypothetical protein [Actinoplanes sp. TBRC 11911]NMO55187.1 hypothetical protein [Actinoplanes sp. TBRC 11911]
MRLILAHSDDAAARRLASLWGDDALLLTPALLCAERMTLTVDRRGRAAASLPSRPAVRAIVCRLGGVRCGDLSHVDSRDAAYAAAELDAFLRAFLAAWPGPVVNRPSDTCLNGPGWRPAQWAAALAVAHPPQSAAGGGEVTVVGERWFGAVSDELGWALAAFAKASGCTLLRASISAAGTVDTADAWPDVSAPPVAEALRGLLEDA